jgi:vinculin
MTPQVINAGKIRLHNVDSPAADQHFENLRREYSDALHRLRQLVDEAIDTGEFIRQSGFYGYSSTITCLYRRSNATLYGTM